MYINLPIPTLAVILLTSINMKHAVVYMWVAYFHGILVKTSRVGLYSSIHYTVYILILHYREMQGRKNATPVRLRKKYHTDNMGIGFS